MCAGKLGEPAEVVSAGGEFHLHVGAALCGHRQGDEGQGRQLLVQPGELRLVGDHWDCSADSQLSGRVFVQGTFKCFI